MKKKKFGQFFSYSEIDFATENEGAQQRTKFRKISTVTQESPGIAVAPPSTPNIHKIQSGKLEGLEKASIDNNQNLLNSTQKNMLP